MHTKFNHELVLIRLTSSPSLVRSFLELLLHSNSSTFWVSWLFSLIPFSQPFASSIMSIDNLHPPLPSGVRQCGQSDSRRRRIVIRRVRVDRCWVHFWVYRICLRCRCSGPGIGEVADGSVGRKRRRLVSTRPSGTCYRQSRVHLHWRIPNPACLRRVC